MKKINVDIDKILELNAQGLSERKIANILNVSRTVIHRRLNVKNRTRKTLYNRDKNFFSKINNLNSYWAGFIAADGCIYNNTVSIELNKIDTNHLIKLRSLLKYNNTLNSRRNTIGLHIVEKQYIEDLKNNFNIVPKKSLILKPPDLKNEDFIRNFIRGYIDGDGHVRKNYLNVRGTKDFLLWMKDCFNNFANLQTKAGVFFDSGTYKLQIQGRIKFETILKWLFTKHTNYTILDRKYQIIKTYVEKPITLNIKEIVPKIREKNIEQLVVIDRKSNMKKPTIAEKYNISISYVNKILKKHNLNTIDNKRLTKEEVKEIRKQIKTKTYKEIAEKYGVVITTIYEIAKKITWKNV